MVATSIYRSGAGGNDKIMKEGVRPGEFLVSEYGTYHCRDNVTVSGGVTGKPHNSVLTDGAGGFTGILFEGVDPDIVVMRGVLTRGPAEVSLARLVFPEAADGADVGSDNVAETALLRKAGYKVTINVFAENKLDVKEGVDWSYWEGGSVSDGGHTALFTDFIRKLQAEQADVSLYDAR